MIKFRSNYHHLRFLRFESADLSTVILVVILAKYITLRLLPMEFYLLPSHLKFNLPLLPGDYCRAFWGPLSCTTDQLAFHYLFIFLLMANFWKAVKCLVKTKPLDTPEGQVRSRHEPAEMLLGRSGADSTHLVCPLAGEKTAQRWTASKCHRAGRDRGPGAPGFKALVWQLHLPAAGSGRRCRLL